MADLCLSPCAVSWEGSCSLPSNPRFCPLRTSRDLVLVWSSLLFVSLPHCAAADAGHTPFNPKLLGQGVLPGVSQGLCGPFAPINVKLLLISLQLTSRWVQMYEYLRWFLRMNHQKVSKSWIQSCWRCSVGSYHPGLLWLTQRHNHTGVQFSRKHLPATVLAVGSCFECKKWNRSVMKGDLMKRIELLDLLDVKLQWIYFATAQSKQEGMGPVAKYTSGVNLPAMSMSTTTCFSAYGTCPFHLSRPTHNSRARRTLGLQLHRRMASQPWPCCLNSDMNQRWLFKTL